MKLLLTFALFVVVTCAARAALFTNPVSADSFVRATAPTLNYGGAGSLAVSGAASTNGSGVANGMFDSFIRFNSGALVTNCESLFGTNNWVITGAKLRVTEMGAPPNTLFNRGTGAFEIRWIANDTWSEGSGTPMAPATIGITFNSELVLLNHATDASLGTFTNTGADGTLNFPLALATAFVNDLRAGGEIGLYLTAIDPGLGFTFDSRSFGTSSARPLLEISAVPRPGIAGISLVGTDLIITATNGAAGETYFTLTSTNMALPLNQWLPVATNVLNVNGNFSVTLTNAANLNAPGQQFFIFQTR